jgi:excisionase family DNA binding protein
MGEVIMMTIPVEELLERMDERFLKIMEQKFQKPKDENVKPDYLTEQELCDVLHLSKPSLWKLRKNKTIPFIKVGTRRLLYELDAVKKALDIN